MWGTHKQPVLQKTPKTQKNLHIVASACGCPTPPHTNQCIYPGRRYFCGSCRNSVLMATPISCIINMPKGVLVRCHQQKRRRLHPPQKSSQLTGAIPETLLFLSLTLCIDPATGRPRGSSAAQSCFTIRSVASTPWERLRTRMRPNKSM